MKQIKFEVYAILNFLIKIVGFLIYFPCCLLLIGLTIEILNKFGRVQGLLLIGILWIIGIFIYFKAKGAFDRLIKQLDVKKQETTESKTILFHSDKIQENKANGDFNTEWLRLAELCKMGDAVAMYDMALLWLNNCSDEEKALIKHYESNTCKETLRDLNEYWKHSGNCSKYEYYMMWIIRAAVYGNLKAKAILDQCSYYKERALIPYKYYVEDETSECFWLSEKYYTAGLCDIIRGKEDCGLIFHKKDGYFEFYYVSYYESADEGGFGSEIEYTSVFYDEFFKQLPIRDDASKEEIMIGLKINEKEREAFWNNQGKNKRQ